jgi:hypothetical protein
MMMELEIRSSSLASIIGVNLKQGDTLAPDSDLFLCYIQVQAALETLFPKFEATGIEKLMFRSMQPKRAVNRDGEMAAGSLMVKPVSFIAACVKLPICQSAWLCTP